MQDYTNYCILLETLFESIIVPLNSRRVKIEKDLKNEKNIKIEKIREYQKILTIIMNVCELDESILEKSDKFPNLSASCLLKSFVTNFGDNKSQFGVNDIQRYKLKNFIVGK